MRRIVPIFVAAAAAMFLGTGMAAASSADQQSLTYQFSDEWHLAYLDGRPTVLPYMADDYVEVRCLHDDQITNWFVNNEALVAQSNKRVDGTGIQVQPHFTGENEKIKITITCERA